MVPFKQVNNGGAPNTGRAAMGCPPVRGRVNLLSGQSIPKGVGVQFVNPIGLQPGRNLLPPE